MSVDIVRAYLEDVELIAPLFDSYRVFYGQVSEMELAREFLSERLTREESVVFLALEGSTGVGFTQLYPSFSSVSARRTYVLNDLFVAPESRGRGVGAALLEKARRFATESRAKRLELATAVDNLTAQRLYESLAWERDDAFHRYYLNV